MHEDDDFWGFESFLEFYDICFEVEDVCHWSHGFVREVDLFVDLVAEGFGEFGFVGYSREIFGIDAPEGEVSQLVNCCSSILAVGGVVAVPGLMEFFVG